MEFTTTSPQQHVEQVTGVSPLARGHGRRERQGKAPLPQPDQAAVSSAEEEDSPLAVEECSDHQIDLRV